MKLTLMLIFLGFWISISAQTKKPLDHPDFAIWNQINNSNISNDGKWVSYEITPGEGDRTLVFYNTSNGQELRFPRAQKSSFTDDNNYAAFTISPAEDSVKVLRRKKVDKEKLPSDTLAILNLTNNNIQKIADLERVSVPERWSGFIAYQVKPAVKKEEAEEKEEGEEKEEIEKVEEERKPEEEKKEEKKKEKAKEPSKKNGYPFIVRNLLSGNEDTLRFVTDYALSKYGTILAAYTTGLDSTLEAGVYMFDCKSPGWRAIKTQKGVYKTLTWNESGDQLAFIADVDTTKAQIRPFEVYRWKAGMDTAVVFVKNHASFMSDGWQVSEHYQLKFSEDGTKLHFGVAPAPLVEDTTLLEEEKVNVEVWHYQDAQLYTQQNVRSKAEKERAYHSIGRLDNGLLRQVANAHLKESRMDRDGNSPYVLVFDEAPYQKDFSWTGVTRRDVWLYTLADNRHVLLAKATESIPQLSPGFNYAYWYNPSDSTWLVSTMKGELKEITRQIPVQVYDELNDVPDHPDAYGMAGWTKGDSAVLVYDRFDIWSVDPTGKRMPVNLTNGREQTWRYRYIRLDREERFIDPSQKLLLHTFNETTKDAGYAELDLKTGQLRQLFSGSVKCDASPLKARDADVIVFTTETYQQFPDLQFTKDRFTTSTRISHANPQQKDYGWGIIELFSWTAYDGQKLQGLLVKPEGFDPTKKYPLIVNFYDRSSDELHTHRTPFPHRSTINYPFYASRGYVIFNPDVPYKIGYPGESAFNAVVSGTQALAKEGFIDQQRMALQGHSWGGYQIAHILTKTGIYRCAEAGAVVVNMTSAYGGIRWETGLSRMFQYEHQQSRIGGTLWEKRDLYLENSPLFSLDKISTPVLILQNDSDGHVPWYQGIEFFTAMRRLGKQAWMLNYIGEPHWPVKLQNRKDLNVRMQQFFDHYLKDAPMPKWMRDGVPAVEKGILQGYELIERK